MMPRLGGKSAYSGGILPSMPALVVTVKAALRYNLCVRIGVGLNKIIGPDVGPCVYPVATRVWRLIIEVKPILLIQHYRS